MGITKKKEAWSSHPKKNCIFSTLGISLHSLSLSFSYFHLFLFAAQISDRLFVSPGRDSESWVSICLSASSSLYPPPLFPSSPSLSPWDLGLSPPVRCQSPSLTPALSLSNCQMKFWVNFKCLKRLKCEIKKCSIGLLDVSCFLETIHKKNAQCFSYGII